LRVLLVDDDANLRALLRTTFDVFDIDVQEAASAAEARPLINGTKPDVIVLDVMMPGIDGIEFCRELKANPHTREIGVVLLSGSEGGARVAADAAGAEAYVPKPFSPLELLAVVERLAGGLYGVPFRATRKRGTEEEQLLLYARDLRHLLQLEREQRLALANAYHDTVAALASALETKDVATRAHSQRVQAYAVELARTIDGAIVDDPSAEYGYLLHDVGKIGIPDGILRKPGALDADERALMMTHTLLGEQMLSGIPFLQGSGIEIVRSHHERWDGRGYPDQLVGDEIPIGARIFAVADALDAMTSDRPYRPAGPWELAREEIMAESGKQFDPDVVAAFLDSEDDLEEIRVDFVAA
jgi:response regulator RpfG family c-di-GMP phosphodiesterase